VYSGSEFILHLADWNMLSVGFFFIRFLMPHDMHGHKLLLYHAVTYRATGHSRLSKGIIAVHLVQRLYVLPVNGHDPAAIRT
jgi:hypothetical protein